MTSEEIFLFIILKLKKRYTSLNTLKTGNGLIHTIVFSDLIYNYHKPSIEINLEPNEYPILECMLENSNYLLMSTKRMLSIFQGEKYSLLYSDYWWHDRIVFNENLPFFNGTSKVFKYYSRKKEEFWYEIDSGEPADAAHNCILYQMRKKVYPSIFIPPNW